MIGNRVHLLELRHVDIAEPSGPAFRCRNLSTSSAVQFVGLTILAFLLLPLCEHFCLDPSSVFSNIAHELSCLITEMGVRRKLKFEGWGRHSSDVIASGFGWCSLGSIG